MKAPLKVLLFSIFIVVVMVLITLYRFDLLKFNIESTTPNVGENVTETTKTSPPSQTPKDTAKDTKTTQNKIDLVNGKKLFEAKTCVLCHGANGAGNTPMGKAVSVTNLTHAKFKSNKDNLPRLEYILQVIENGVPGTAMVSFKDQIPSQQDKLDLASYVNSLHK